MPPELVADGRADRSGAAAVDDANAGQPRERRLVDEGADGLPRVLGPLPTYVELVGDVSARRCHDAHRRLLRLVRAGAAARVGAEARDRDPDPVAPAADDLGLVVLERDDRPA